LSTVFEKKFKNIFVQKKEPPGQHYYCPGGEGGKKGWEKEGNPPLFTRFTFPLIH